MATHMKCSFIDFLFRLMDIYKRMMFVSALSVFLLVMLTIPGVLASDWSVTYNTLDICAAEGTSVDMLCNYIYPTNLTVEQAFWTNDNSKETDITHDPNYTNRTTVDCGDLQEGPCNLTIQEVKKGDDVIYYCRIITNVEKEKWTGKPGVTLKIADLQVTGAQNSTEGEDIDLTCNTTSTLTSSPSFIWSKDGRPVVNKTIISNQLRFNPVSYEDMGNYTCAVHAGYPSPAFPFNVEYSPKETTASVSPSGQVVEGSQVNLTCSSKANPPVAGYTWYKKSGDEDREIGDQKIFIFEMISHQDSGEYHCRVTNNLGNQNSPSVSLNVSYSPKETTVSVSPSGQVVEGSQVTLTCITKANPPVTGYTWYKSSGNEDREIGDQNIFMFEMISHQDSGEYHCRATNYIGDQISPPVSLNVLYRPRNTLVSVNPSTQTPQGATVITEGTSVTLTCSSDANPPVENYTWFKVNESTPVGSARQYNITNIRSVDGGLYFCVARNKMGTDNSCHLQLNVSDTVIAESQDMLMYILIAIAVVCGVVILVCAAVIWSRRRNGNKESTRRDKDKEENQYVNMGFQGEDGTGGPKAAGGAEGDAQYASIQPYGSRPSGVAQGEEDQYATVQPKSSRQTAGGVENEVQYATVQPKSSRQTAGGVEDEAQYATVQPKSSRQTAGELGVDVQYASVQFKKATAAEGLPAQSDQEDSVIYSGVHSQQPSR